MLEQYYKFLRQGSLEATVYYLAVNTSEWNEFHIEYIRWDAFFQMDTALSYKQVRNAIFRLRAKGLPIRHIARGTYRWTSK